LSLRSNTSRSALPFFARSAAGQYTPSTAMFPACVPPAPGLRRRRRLRRQKEIQVHPDDAGSAGNQYQPRQQVVRLHPC
jgi:hypothetical protein